MMNIMGGIIFYSWEDIEADLNNPDYCKKWLNNGKYEVGDIVGAIVKHSRVKKIPLLGIKYKTRAKINYGKIIEIRDLFTTNYRLLLSDKKEVTIEKPDILCKL